MKPPVLNLTGKTIGKNVTSLWNVGPDFFPTPKPIPYVEIITAIESLKQEKNYSMRAVVSTVELPSYGTSKYLVKIIQPKWLQRDLNPQPLTS